MLNSQWKFNQIDPLTRSSLIDIKRVKLTWLPSGSTRGPPESPLHTPPVVESMHIWDQLSCFRTTQLSEIPPYTLVLQSSSSPKTASASASDITGLETSWSWGLILQIYISFCLIFPFDLGIDLPDCKILFWGRRNFPLPLSQFPLKVSHPSKIPPSSFPQPAFSQMAPTSGSTLAMPMGWTTSDTSSGSENCKFRNSAQPLMYSSNLEQKFFIKLYLGGGWGRCHY